MAESMIPKKKQEPELNPVELVKTNDYDPALTPAESNILSGYFTGMRDTSAKTAPLICKGEDCEVYRSCPLAQMKKKLPLQKVCPVEKALVDIWTQDLMNELEIEPGEHVDKAQISDVVRARLFNKRAQEILANSKSIIMAFRGMTEEGQPILEPKLHPMMYSFDRNAKIIQDNLSALLATRDAKSKDKSRSNTSPAVIVAQVMHKMQNLEIGDKPKLKEIKGRPIPPPQIEDAHFELLDKPTPPKEGTGTEGSPG